MKKKFEGKVAVISGASSGIGLAIAKRLKDEGMRLYDISKKVVENEIFEKAYECDISNDALVKTVVDDILQREKNIDMLFCNAGFGIGGLIENTNLDTIDSIMNVNLIAHMKMTRLFLKNINPNGRIVFTGSVATFIPLPYQACYGASKAGIESFARALSTEVKSKKIKVVTFMPGDVNSGFTDARIKQVGQDKKEKHGIEKMEKAERRGETPDFVAKKVVRIIKRKNPPTRVTIGAVWKIVYGLVKIIPIRLLTFLVEKIYI